jgi:uncharacterized protein
MRPRRSLLRLGALLLALAPCAALAQAPIPGTRLDTVLNTLAKAAAENNTEGVEARLRERVDPNLIDETGRSPLGYAAAFGNTEMAKALLEGGARVDYRDKLGDTALHRAAEAGQAQMVRLLLAANAPVDATNRQGITPLMLAADANKVEAVRVLLAGGADPKKQDFSGRDALGWAAGKPGPLHLLEQAAAH